MNPTSCIVWITAIFSTELCSENAGETSIVLWITAREKRIPTSHNPNQNRAALWQILSSNECEPANMKTGFHANRDLNKQEAGFIFAVSSTELSNIFKYSRVKLKNQKPIAVDVLSRPIRWYSHADPIWSDGTFKSAI